MLIKINKIIFTDNRMDKIERIKIDYASCNSGCGISFYNEEYVKKYRELYQKRILKVRTTNSKRFNKRFEPK